MQKLKDNITVFLLKLTGWISGVGLTALTTYTQLLKEQPKTVKVSITGVLILGLIAMLYLGFIKKKVDHKLQAIAVADELNVIGKTGALKRAILNFIYLVYPLIILYVFAIGVENYEGKGLSQNILYLIVSIGIGSGIFSTGIALERKNIKRNIKVQIEQEQDAIARKTVEYLRK